MTKFPKERAFVLTANAGLNRLETLEREDCGNAPIAAMLDQIYLAALPVKAKGVMKACELCSTVFQATGWSDQYIRSVLSLKQLVSQYKDGLLEIDPTFASVLDGAKPARSNAPDKDGIEELEGSARHQEAANTLEPLIHFAQSSSERAALSFLAHYSAEPDATQKTESDQRVNFDRVLQNISSATLRSARLRGKSVSVSYSTDIETVRASLAKNVQAALIRLGEAVIAYGVSEQTRSLILNIFEQDNGIECKLVWVGNPLEPLIVRQLIQSAQLEDLIRSGSELAMDRRDTATEQRAIKLYIPRARSGHGNRIKGGDAEQRRQLTGVNQ